jgi:hypothetical protein
MGNAKGNYCEKPFEWGKNMVEETTGKRTIEKGRTDENVIYVGKKPPMNYVLASSNTVQFWWFR